MMLRPHTPQSLSLGQINTGFFFFGISIQRLFFSSISPSYSEVNPAAKGLEKLQQGLA